jgi:hypothetical protein
MNSLPSEAKARKASPIAEGVLWYFPNALAAIAAVSKAGNDQHNPGQPMHWSRGKSTDHADCILRHLIDAGTMDSDGIRHTAKVAWRALALLQEELEREEGYPLPRNAKETNDGQVPPNAVSASDCKESLLPMEGRSWSPGDVGRDGGSLCEQCSAPGSFIVVESEPRKRRWFK